MLEKNVEILINTLLTDCGLGTIILPIESVPGGYLHRMYKVTTDSGIYAVKHLNPEIMNRPDALDNFERAESIEYILEKAGISIIPAIVVNENKMQKVQGNYFYIFKWQEGNITDWNHISPMECFAIGDILGKIHAIQPRNIEHQPLDVSKIDWNHYINIAEEGSGISFLLRDNIELLDYAQKELNHARALLPDVQCLSNEDMDPKNVMWDQGKPWVIDLECLDYGNPVSDALQLSLQWSGTVTYELDVNKLITFFEGYLKAYDNGFRGYGDVIGLAYTWIEWLEYNLKRALGNHVDEEEKQLGILEVENTLNRIKYIYSKEQLLRDVFSFQLPKVNPEVYDNHDDRICYYELLLANDISGIRQYELPDGYRFVPYAEGDRDTWIEIERSAKEFISFEQGLEAWNRYFADHLDILPGRMVFIENYKGEKVATATAYYDIYGRDNSGDGWLHWVAVRRDYQGKGLSKPLIIYVLNILYQLGHTCVKIPTQTNTWVACKVYMDLGFLPVKENLQHSCEGWRIIKALTGHEALNNVR